MLRLHTLLALSMTLVSGCYSFLPSDGGGQAGFAGLRAVEPADVIVPDGYLIEPIATGLTFPTGVAFDGQGTPYVTESGYSYGEVFTSPRLLRIGAGGAAEVITEGGQNGPWNGLTWHNGAFYVAEGGELEGGRILRVIPGQAPQVVVAGLPSVGDHHTNGPVVGPDGWLYFGQGTATNSAVVGTDNADFGWLRRYPDFHDTPCRDITLNGMNYRSENPLTEASDMVETGAFVPFGTPTVPGQVIRGSVPCNGAILRVRPQGGPVELVAWGLRNPFGLAFGPGGALYATENGYDERGSRPVWGTADHLWRIERETWYGWPDYSGGKRVDQRRSDQPRFAAPGEPPPQPLLAALPGTPPQPLAYLGVHSSSNGLDVAPASFGYGGQVFISQFGDMAPDVGKVMDPVGFRVVRVDLATGTVRNFAINRGGAGPASKLGSGGLERPTAVRFGPDGALYVVDFGVMTMSEQGPNPRPGTGVLWRVTRAGG